MRKCSLERASRLPVLAESLVVNRNMGKGEKLVLLPQDLQYLSVTPVQRDECTGSGTMRRELTRT